MVLFLESIIQVWIRPSALRDQRGGNNTNNFTFFAKGGDIAANGHFRLDMQTRLDIEPPLDDGHGSGTEPLVPARRPPMHAPRGRRVKAPQLAWFCLSNSQG